MNEKEEVDLVDNMIKKTGCAELLYQVQVSFTYFIELGF